MAQAVEVGGNAALALAANFEHTEPFSVEATLLSMAIRGQA